MRFIIALAVAAALSASLFAYARWTIADVESRVRERLRERQTAGNAPAELQGLDSASIDIWSMGIQLPHADMNRFQFARWLMDRWFVWGIAVIGLCVGVAFLTRHKA